MANQKNKFNKLLIILPIVFLLILITGLVCLFFILKKGAIEEQNQKAEIERKAQETTTAFGVALQNNCYQRFEGFLKVYGADYEKCLKDFDFTEQFCGGFDPDTQALSNVNIIVILDSSGSMSEKLYYGETKISIAKKAVFDFLTAVPSGVNTGLLVYGHKGSNSLSDKELSCKGIEEIVKLGQNNSSNIISLMDSFQPKGWTPIAGSLNFAKDIFKKAGPEDKNYLILLSDGVESCDGNPLSAAENLKREIPNVKLMVIEFTTDNEIERYLDLVAKYGGGEAMNATTSVKIAKAFEKQLLFIKRECLQMTFQKTSLRYKANNLENLNCWLDGNKKEGADFNNNLVSKSLVSEAGCNQKMSEALSGRSTDYWNKKQDLQNKNDEIFKQKKIEYERQLEEINEQIKNSGL